LKTFQKTFKICNYFIPREAAINKLLEKYAGNETMIEYAAQNEYETELYSKYSQHYGYVFYIEFLR